MLEDASCGFQCCILRSSLPFKTWCVSLCQQRQLVCRLSANGLGLWALDMYLDTVERQHPPPRYHSMLHDMEGPC